ncbi:MAG: hypothetical protein ACOY94_23140 [Bacillota bacterium]
MTKPLKIYLILLALLLAGCTGNAEVDRLEQENKRLVKEVDRLRELAGKLQRDLKEGRSGAIPASLVEPRYLDIPGGTDKWTYRQTLKADLDGDGQEETVTVLNSAAVDPKTGEVGWDDGHPWHVYVDEPDGARTVIFARWVQLGQLRVMLADDQRTLILLDEQGAGTAIYRVKYQGPNQFEAVELLRFGIWDRATFVR